MLTGVKKLLQSTAQLEFWETFKAEDIGPYLGALDQKLAEVLDQEKEDVAQEELEETTSDIDSLLSDIENDSLDVKKANPLLGLRVSAGFQGSPVISTFATKDTATINGYLKSKEAKNYYLQTYNLQDLPGVK
jgi:SecD/SecF fusion protein